jgi:hypothetical protein
VQRTGQAREQRLASTQEPEHRSDGDGPREPTEILGGMRDGEERDSAEQNRGRPQRQTEPVQSRPAQARSQRDCEQRRARREQEERRWCSVERDAALDLGDACEEPPACCPQ